MFKITDRFLSVFQRTEKRTLMALKNDKSLNHKRSWAFSRRHFFSQLWSLWLDFRLWLKTPTTALAMNRLLQKSLEVLYSEGTNKGDIYFSCQKRGQSAPRFPEQLSSGRGWVAWCIFSPRTAGGFQRFIFFSPQKFKSKIHFEFQPPFKKLNCHRMQLAGWWKESIIWVWKTSEFQKATYRNCI